MNFNSLSHPDHFYKGFPIALGFMLHECICSYFRVASCCQYFDMAYQGFASGDTDRGCMGLEDSLFRMGHKVLVAQSICQEYGSLW